MSHVDWFGIGSCDFLVGRWRGARIGDAASRVLLHGSCNSSGAMRRPVELYKTSDDRIAEELSANKWGINDNFVKRRV